MLTKGPRSGVDLVKLMQAKRDRQNGWMMFHYMRHMDKWSTMACHMYNLQYKKVMTIAIFNMQSKDIRVQIQFWRILNVVMSIYKVDHPNFKGFMVDSAKANWNAV